VTLIKDVTREMWGWPSVERAIQDLRYGLRMLHRSPGFTSAAILSLALGIGANTAMFSVVNAVLLRALPFENPDQLVRVGETDLHEAPSIGEVSYPNFLDWRAQNHVFNKMAVFHTVTFTVTGGNETIHLEGGVVSADLFSPPGVTPCLGRRFLPEEDQPGGGGKDRPVILSTGFWRKHFGSKPNVLGEKIDLNGKNFTVVGVMCKAFQYPIQPDRVELWTTIGVDTESSDGKPPTTADRGTRYETAWTWLHKLRRAMVRSGRDRLTGRVEVDEAYLAD
jgi:putative ABC transport system permease protein